MLNHIKGLVEEGGNAVIEEEEDDDIPLVILTLYITYLCNTYFHLLVVVLYLLPPFGSGVIPTSTFLK